MKFRNLSVLAAGVSLLLSGSARGGPLLVPTAQTRSVTVSASVFDKTDSDSRTSTNFDTFDESLTVHPILIVDGERYASQGNAAQKSTLGDDTFTFSGSIYAQSIHPADSKAIGRSLFDVTFDVTSPARYKLIGSLHNPNETPAAGKLQFTLMEGNKVLFETNAGPDDINQSGVLGASSYRLLLDAGGLGNSSAAGGGVNYDLSFAATASDAAIPLPPAAWSGLTIAGMVAVRRGLKVLRRG